MSAPSINFCLTGSDRLAKAMAADASVAGQGGEVESFLLPNREKREKEDKEINNTSINTGEVLVSLHFSTLPLLTTGPSSRRSGSTPRLHEAHGQHRLRTTHFTISGKNNPLRPSRRNGSGTHQQQHKSNISIMTPEINTPPVTTGVSVPRIGRYLTKGLKRYARQS